jgi:hypothetical protein
VKTSWLLHLYIRPTRLGVFLLGRKDLRALRALRIDYAKPLRRRTEPFLERMNFWRATPLSQVKSPYAHANVDPNRTTQFLVAVLAGLQVPFICSETHELGEELVASYLYQVHLYRWLESNDYGRFLSDNDI